MELAKRAMTTKRLDDFTADALRREDFVLRASYLCSDVARIAMVTQNGFFVKFLCASALSAVKSGPK